MFLVFFRALFGGFLVRALFALGLLLRSKKEIRQFSERTPFECGYLGLNLSRERFSMQFYIIALVFLIFDRELILLLPFVFCIRSIAVSRYIGYLLLVVSVLLAGLFYERVTGGLR